MSTREYIDSVGKLVCPAIGISQKQLYHNYKPYMRWYGYYSLSGSVLHKFKLYRSNG